MPIRKVYLILGFSPSPLRGEGGVRVNDGFYTTPHPTLLP